ncbi:MAG: hypothetical protein O2821_08345, partial [Chloroflexi bacterium]|nr:hypothetical protein [Chloroflexota bacterium]
MFEQTWQWISANPIEVAVALIIALIVAAIRPIMGIFGRCLRWIWRLFRRRPVALHPSDSQPFLYATSYENFASRIGEFLPNLVSGLEIPYQSRLPAAAQSNLYEQIDGSRYLVLHGRTGLGKTRECAEAVRRLQCRVRDPVTVMRPQPPFTGNFIIPNGVSDRHIVLLIDDLQRPPFYTEEGQGSAIDAQGQFPNWLRQCLQHFASYPDFRVIATARDDQRDYTETTKAIRSILDEYKFSEWRLPSWSGDKLDDLVSAVASWRGVTLRDDAAAELARRCQAEGTPNYARLGISLVKPGDSMTMFDVEALPTTFDTLWGRTWRERIAIHPPRVAIFRALALQQQSGVSPLKPVVTELAARLLGRPLWWRRWLVRRHLAALAPWVAEGSGTLDCPDSYLPADASMSHKGTPGVLAEALRHASRRNVPGTVPALVGYGNFLVQYALGERSSNLEEA